MKIVEENKVIYREVQRPQQTWLWVVVLLITAFMWYSFIQQIIFGIPIGNNPASNIVLIIFWIIFGILFPLIILGLLKLIIEVRHDGLYIRFMPIHIRYKQFLFKDIKQYKTIVYSSFKRFGGWGIRVNFMGETAYNMNGEHGLELKLRNRTVVVGTQKPNELKKAMDLISSK